MHLTHTHRQVTSAVRAGTRPTRRRGDHQSHRAAVLAHAVRSPLHGLYNCLELLENQLDTASHDIAETLALMRDGLGSIDLVTRRYLRPCLGRGAARLHTPLGELLAIVERRMTGVAEMGGTGLQVEDPAAGLALDIDLDRVVEALCNVVDNAIDASLPGGNVTIRAREGVAASVALEVEDQGPGIPSCNHDRVLDPFFTTKPPSEGSGLGLTIAATVMEDHGGKLEIRNRQGGGTVVKLIFPAPCSCAERDTNPVATS